MNKSTKTNSSSNTNNSIYVIFYPVPTQGSAHFNVVTQNENIVAAGRFDVLMVVLVKIQALLDMVPSFWVHSF